MINRFPRLTVWLPSIVVFLLGFMALSPVAEFLMFAFALPIWDSSLPHERVEQLGRVAGIVAAALLAWAMSRMLRRYVAQFQAYDPARAGNLSYLMVGLDPAVDRTHHRRMVDVALAFAITVTLSLLVPAVCICGSIGNRHLTVLIGSGTICVQRLWYQPPVAPEPSYVQWNIVVPAELAKNMWLSFQLPSKGDIWIRPIGPVGYQLPKEGQFVVVPPLWLALPVSIAVLLRFRRPIGRAFLPRRPPSSCVSCGYNLTGNVSGICPECGTSCRAVS